MTMAKKIQTQETEQVELFRIFKKDERFIIVCGNAQISSKTFDSIEKAKAYIKSKPWELIVNTTLYLVNSYNEQLKNQPKEENK